MKILMITDNLMKGGKERRLMELLLYFEKLNNIKIFLVLLKDLVEYPAVHKLTCTQLFILPRRIKKDPTILFKLWKICYRNKPDIVHSWGSQPSVYISPICFFLNIPLINGMITNAFFKKYSKTWLRARLTFPFSKIIISNSKAGLSSYAADTKKGRVIYNGVHLSRFENLPSPELIRDKLQINKKYVVGMVGAFHPRKDYFTYLKAAKKIVSERDDICFLTIGDGKLESECKKIVDNVSNDKIMFLGRCDNVEQYINIFDIGVLLTNTDVHLEGISNSLIEYMSLRKPVIATKGGGTNELIKDNIDGILIDSNAEHMFIEKIHLLINNDALRGRIGQQARVKIENKFTIESMTKNYLKLYEDLLGRK